MTHKRKPPSAEGRLSQRRNACGTHRLYSEKSPKLPAPRPNDPWRIALFLAEGCGRCRERSIHPGCDPRILDAPNDGRPLVILIKDRGQGPDGLDPVLVRRVLTTCQGAMVLWQRDCDECGYFTMAEYIKVARATGKPVVFIQTCERWRDEWLAVGEHYIFGAGRAEALS